MPVQASCCVFSAQTAARGLMGQIIKSEVEQFQDDLNALMERYALTSNLTVVEIIGVLHVAQFEILRMNEEIEDELDYC